MSHAPLNRQIRLFISSTFQDLQAEREYLIKKVLPLLQVEAAKRYVSIIPLDLRWGVTEEEANSGKVLEICLKEIDKSYPYFIGLIGSRYGWTPPIEEFYKNPVLREEYSWLMSDLEEGMSVTEIEMQYGVLRRNTDDGEVAGYFYFRNDNNDSNDIDPKLEELKKKITTAHSNVNTGVFYNVEHLGNLVMQDMLQLLDKLYPESEISDTVRKRYTNKYYYESLCRDYIPINNYQSALDKFVEGDDDVLIISGKSGSGKSALLANWLKTNTCENKYVAGVFVDSGIADNDPEKAFDFVYSELVHSILGDDCDLFEDPHLSEIGLIAYIKTRFPPESSLKKLFWLPKIFGDTVRGKLLLLIDGLDHISNTIPLSDIITLKSNYKIVISASEDSDLLSQLRMYDDNLKVLYLDEVTVELKSAIVDSVLEGYGKKLSDSQKAQVVDCPLMSNLVILHSFLDEIVEYGSYENLDSFISGYLAAYDELDFYKRIISRYETDYSYNLVSQALSLIFYSGSGISEYEILDIIGIKTYQWSQFYYAFSRHLFIVDGLLRIQNKLIRQVLSNRYGYLEEECRRKIITSSSHSRQWFVLPYQYYHLNDTGMLYKGLCNLLFFAKWYYNNKEQLRDFWKLLKHSAGYSLQEYFFKISAKTKASYHSFETFAQFADLFDDEISTSICLYEQAIKRLDANQTAEEARLLSRIGYKYIQMQEYDKALSILYDSLGKYQVAYVEDVPKMAELYSKISYIYTCYEMLDEALEFAEKATHAYGKPDSLLISYYEQRSSIRLILGYATAYDLYVALSYSETFYGKKHPITNRIAVRKLYAEIKERSQNGIDADLVEQFSRELDLYLENWGEESIDSALGYEYLSDVLLMQDKCHDALRVAEKARIILERELGSNHFDTRMLYRLFSRIYAKQNNFQEALDWIEKSAPSKDESGGGFSKALELKAQIYMDMDEWENAIDCLDKAITHWYQLYKDDSKSSLNDRETMARIYLSIGQFNKAIDCYDYIVGHCGKYKLFYYEEQACVCKAMFYLNEGQYERAIGFYDLGIKYSRDSKKRSYYHEQVGDAYLKNHDLINACFRYMAAKQLLLLSHCSTNGIDNKISQIEELVTKKGFLYRMIFKLNWQRMIIIVNSNNLMAILSSGLPDVKWL